MVKEKVEALASAKYYCFRFVAFTWHQFQWLRVTSIPDFKVTILSRNMQVSHAAMYSTFDRSYTRILQMYEYTNSTHGDNSFFLVTYLFLTKSASDFCVLSHLFTSQLWYIYSFCMEWYYIWSRNFIIRF